MSFCSAVNVPNKQGMQLYEWILYIPLLQDWINVNGWGIGKGSPKLNEIVKIKRFFFSQFLHMAMLKKPHGGDTEITRSFVHTYISSTTFNTQRPILLPIFPFFSKRRSINSVCTLTIAKYCNRLQHAISLFLPWQKKKTRKNLTAPYFTYIEDAISRYIPNFLHILIPIVELQKTAAF